GPVSRRWPILLATVGVGWLFTIGSFAAAGVAAFANLPLNWVVHGYILSQLWRLSQRGELRHEARLPLVSLSLTLVVIILEQVWWMSGSRQLLGGIHAISAGIVLFAASQALVLSRQHVARERALEQTANELRRQIADRAGQL